MKIKKQDRQSTIKTMVASLPPATETAPRKKTFTGEELIAKGGIKDASGKFYVRQQKYTISYTVEIPVNHEQRIGRIIDSAKDYDDMTTKLAKYLNKYGKPTATIAEENPEPTQ